MPFKQMLGFVLLSIGVVFLIFSFLEAGEISEEGSFTYSPVSPTERIPEIKQTPSERKQVQSQMLISGLIMILVGGFVAIRYREKHL